MNIKEKVVLLGGGGAMYIVVALAAFLSGESLEFASEAFTKGLGASDDIVDHIGGLAKGTGRVIGGGAVIATNAYLQLKQ